MIETVRLSKLMAERGFCSRREADQFIKQGQVLVDGKRVNTLGIKILPDQTIELTESASQRQAQRTTVLLNKPLGYVSGLPEKGYQSAVMLVNKENRQFKNELTPSRKGLAPAGRLDIDSMGLMVFTQDGRIAKTLIHPESEIEKEYNVWVEGEITPEKILLLRNSRMLDNKTLKPVKIKHVAEQKLNFILTQGRKRQIRRMCALVELKVTKLVRIRMGRIQLEGLVIGKWRLLKPSEYF